MTIVAGVDRSNRAKVTVREAKALADAFGDELHVVHVLGRSEFIELEHPTYEGTERAVEMDVVKRVAAEIAAEADEAVVYTAVGLVGKATDELLRYSREHDARYIVIGGHRRSPVRKAFFGSTTQQVLLNADRPVVTAVEHGS